MITAALLREVLHYNPEIGTFTWIVARGRVKVGDVAGSLTSHGYSSIRIGKRLYRAHRLAWLWMMGSWPMLDVDHRDLDRANNRWANLREATRSENGANTRANSNNKSGLKGVFWHKNSSKWKSRVEVNGKRYYLGRFDCPAAAHFAYIIAAEKYFGEFARAA